MRYSGKKVALTVNDKKELEERKPMNILGRNESQRKRLRMEMSLVRPRT